MFEVAAFAQLPAVGRGSNTCVYVIAAFTMCESTEQSICIKFCFKIGKTATVTYQLLQQAYGEDAMGRTQVFDWFRRFKEGRSKTKVTLVAFFDSDGIVHHEYAPDGQTINKEFYLEFLRRLRESVRRKVVVIVLCYSLSVVIVLCCYLCCSVIIVLFYVLIVRTVTLPPGVNPIAVNKYIYLYLKRPEKRRDGDWILHHDNAPAHTSHLVQQFWSNTAPLSCSSRHTHQISHRVTFSYSHGLRKFLKDTDLRQRRTSNEIRRRYY